MNVLVIAPHPDDELIGCGGTIKKLSDSGNNVYVLIVTRGYYPLFDEQIIIQGRQEDIQANKDLGTKDVFFLNCPASEMDTLPLHKISEAIQAYTDKYEIDEMYIPFEGDIHIDHQIVSKAAMVAGRPKGNRIIKRIYAYEVVSETGWNIPSANNVFIPDVYVDISDTISDKLNVLRKFTSQIQEYPAARSVECISALATYRGCTINVPAAEGFMLIREIK